MFLVFLFAPFIGLSGIAPPRLVSAALAVVVFATWYVLGYLAAEDRPPAWMRVIRPWPWLAGLVLLTGVVAVLVGPSGLSLLVYVAAGAGALLVGVAAPVVILASGLVYAVTASLLGVPRLMVFGIGVWVIFIGLIVLQSARASRSEDALLAEREHKASMALDLERARLARDLHDILGHSLTVVTIKAELAGALIDVDPEHAKVEIADVERLARDALADVRATVSSYRTLSLPAELVGARRMLQAAGIRALVPGSADEVASDLRELFAWVVREGVTNIVRHSAARTATVVLAENSVEVGDDGRGRSRGQVAGNGLRGLQERATQAGATLSVGPGPQGRGTLLRVQRAAGAGSPPANVTEAGGAR